MFDRVRTAARVATLVGAVLLIGSSASAQSWRTLTSSRQVQGTGPVNVDIDYGAGELTVEPASGTLLYKMQLRYDEQTVSPIAEYDGESRTLHLGAKGREERRNEGRKEASRATIALTPSVPLDLDLKFGAGEADIDLGGLRLQRLDLSTGASETRVRFGAPNPIRARRVAIKAGAAELKVSDLGNVRAEHFSFQGGVGSTTLEFGGAWSQSATASVQMGVGSMVLRFPRGLGVRVNKSSLLSSFRAEDLVKRGNSYYSRDFDRAPHKLTIDVDAAFGSIEIEWID